MTGKKINKSGSVRVTIANWIAPTSGPISAGITPDIIDPNVQLDKAAEEAIGEIDRPRKMMPTINP